MLSDIPGVTEQEKKRLLHCVVVGGGPTGVEFSRELSDFNMKDVHQRYSHVKDYIHVTLNEALEKLKEVLEGYEAVEVVPSLFILMGNFCSTPCNLSFHYFASLSDVVLCASLAPTKTKNISQEFHSFVGDPEISRTHAIKVFWDHTKLINFSISVSSRGAFGENIDGSMGYRAIFICKHMYPPYDVFVVFKNL